VWCSLLYLARCRAVALGRLKEFNVAYASRLGTGPQLNACWGALRDLRLREDAARIEELANTRPLRKNAYGQAEVKMSYPHAPLET
jgi:hypothetical protein